MCGIVGGFWRRPDAGANGRLKAALTALRHRGPDDEGLELYDTADGTLALGHTRLAIIDLSSAAHQPMASRDLRYSLIFNGEIYNYRELRRELIGLGHVFASDSDTEVLLAAWSEWHAACLTRLEGMFAFVMYDRSRGRLTCARDAFGIKPFFYDWSADRFLFASEQPALLTLRGEARRVNWQRSYDYLVHGDYDSREETFVEGVKHLLPGHVLEVGISSDHSVTANVWWRPGFRETMSLPFEDAAEAVREKFLHNVRIHLRSDVPIGAALSGGIDSSAVVCAMRHIEPSMPINTFSYIADGSHLSEERWVDLVSGHVGAHSYKVSATGEDLVRDLDRMIQIQGEPFGSTSIYAQYRVFQLARERGVTVTLEGQGADELLAGYSGYPGYRLLSLLEKRRLCAAASFAHYWSRWPGRSCGFAYMDLGRVVLPDSLYRPARRLLGRDFAPTWLNVGHLLDAGIRLTEPRQRLDRGAAGRRVVERLASALQTRGLPGLLRHGDRNAMRFSIESRVPFLTLSFAEFLLALPENYLVSDRGQTKHVFRAAMRGIVPDEILDRKDKVGFETPEKDWLLGMASKLREWLNACDGIPFINKAELVKAFDEAVSGQLAFTWQVWRWVNYVRWYSLFIDDN